MEVVIDITYLGHSSFKIKSKGAVVVTDPYDSKSTGLKFPKTEAQIVLVSHEHPDHSNSMGVDGSPKVISGPGEYEVRCVSVVGIPSYHDGKKGEERGSNTIYVFNVDGVVLCHLGDLGHKLSQDQLSEIGDVDILFVPVGGVYTIDASDAVEVIASIDPKIVIPMHYKVEGLTYELGDLNKFVKEIGMEPSKTERFTIARDSLPESRQLVIFT